MIGEQLTIENCSIYSHIKDKVLLEGNYRVYNDFDFPKKIKSLTMINEIIEWGVLDGYGLSFFRTDSNTLILRRENDVFIEICSDFNHSHIRIYAKNMQILSKFEEITKPIIDKFEVKSDDVIIDIDLLSLIKGELIISSFAEEIPDTILKSAYPGINEKYGSVENFSKKFYNSSENVLILQGVPGTGKTKFLRKLLKEFDGISTFSRRINVLYINNNTVADNDGVYIKFITENYDALIIEDVDHLLGTRADGNQVMSNFLCASDGLIRSMNKKIIFTTNLPNELFIDDALLRPGRCFDILKISMLTNEQARDVLFELHGDNSPLVDQLKPKNNTLAEIYKLVGNES